MTTSGTSNAKATKQGTNEASEQPNKGRDAKPASPRAIRIALNSYRDLPSDAADGDADDRQNPPSVTSDGDAGSTGDAEDRQKATTANADGETEEIGDGKTGEVDVAGPCWDRRASLPPAGAVGAVSHTARCPHMRLARYPT